MSNTPDNPKKRDPFRSPHNWRKKLEGCLSMYTDAEIDDLIQVLIDARKAGSEASNQSMRMEIEWRDALIESLKDENQRLKKEKDELIKAISKERENIQHNFDTMRDRISELEQREAQPGKKEIDLSKVIVKDPIYIMENKSKPEVTTKPEHRLTPNPDSDGWNFDYELILKITRACEDEHLSMEQVDKVMTVLCDLGINPHRTP